MKKRTKFNYQGKEVEQVRLDNLDFIYKCDGHTFESIYKLSFYINPTFVDKDKKKDKKTKSS